MARALTVSTAFTLSQRLIFYRTCRRRLSQTATLDERRPKTAIFHGSLCGPVERFLIDCFCCPFIAMIYRVFVALSLIPSAAVNATTLKILCRESSHLGSSNAIALSIMSRKKYWWLSFHHFRQWIRASQLNPEKARLWFGVCQSV